MTDLTALGMTDGVGSMLVGAKEQGYHILGNVEWRRYYHTGTWQHNFNNAWMVHNWDQAKVPEDVTLVMGHPECGQWSALAYSSLGNTVDRWEVPSDIPLFIEGIRKIKPEFFAMDNLVKSLRAVPLTKWNEELPEYDIFAEYISNYHYGNIQLNRKRMFIIAAKKKYGYAFVPGEEDHGTTVWDLIGDLHGKDENYLSNHWQFPDYLRTPMREYEEKIYVNVARQAEIFKDIRSGLAPRYLDKDGNEKSRIGMMKLHKDKHGHTITGCNYHMHPVTAKPLTCRERARFQGFPDTFQFLFNKPSDRFNTNMARQTGKAMPVQFCRFLSNQFKEHYQSTPIYASGKRHLRDPLIEESKLNYCKNIGYSDQERACTYCSIEECGMRQLESVAPYVKSHRRIGGGGYKPEKQRKTPTKTNQEPDWNNPMFCPKCHAFPCCCDDNI